MANRPYLYSINKKPKKGERVTVKDVCEWRWYMPVSFLVLISGNPEVCDSLIWEGEEAIIGEYKLGIERYKKLIDMLMDNQVQDPETFSREAKKSLAFLTNESVKQDYFFLETNEIIELAKIDSVSKYDNKSIIETANALAWAIDNNSFETLNKWGDLKNNWEDQGALLLDLEIVPNILYFTFNEELTVK